jgi:hypothetical protein
MGQEITGVGVWAIGRDCIDLVRSVRAVHVSFSAAPAAARPDHHDTAPAHRQFALDAEEFRPEVEDEVVRRSVQGSRDADAELYALVNDRGLGDEPLFDLLSALITE